MQELKKRRIWLCWIRTKTKDGKWTKVPISASGGETGTDAAHSDTWVTYDEAEQASRKRNYSGVGFVVPEGFFMLDVDHKDQDDPLIKKLLDRFDTYAEVSVSGHGLHIIGECDLNQVPTYIDKEGRLRLSREFYQKNTGTGIELYIGGITSRYSTYSGNAVCDIPVQECTESVLITLEQDMRRAAKEPAPKKLKAEKKTVAVRETVKQPEGAEELDTQAFDVVASLRSQKNGEKFTQLYDRGDISGYGSQSEADLALCSLIAYRAGNNPELIDSIFRTSQLYRDKWEREDYRTETVRKAILLCAGKFHPSAMDCPHFVKLKGKNREPTLVPSLLAQYIRETVPFILVQNNCKQTTMVYVFDNGRYVLCDKNKMIGIIKQPVEEYDIELVNTNKLNEVYNQLITDRDRVQQNELNADEHLINFENGLLEVTPTEMILYPHSPEIYSTIQIPCAWEEKETATPVFDAYLDTLTDGNPEIRKLLLEYIGMCISNVKGWRTKKALFLVGPGDSGKSVIKALVERILGEGNFVAIDLQEIEARFGTGVVYGNRLAGSSDMSYISVSELKTFKKLTGGDGIFAEFKGQQGFEYTYTGMLWFCMNRLPKFGGDDGQWVYDRIMVVRCNHVIPKAQQDKTLLDKLYEERTGIIHKAVQALQGVIANGYRFSEPESVVEERAEYQKENNTVIEFFEECMCERDFGKEPEYTVSQIHTFYLEYCKRNNYRYPKGMKEFRDRLMEYLDIPVYKDLARHFNRGTCYINYTLKEEAKREFCDFVA